MKAAGSITLLNVAASTPVGAADRHGPTHTGRFRVEIDGVEVPGWRWVRIPSSSTEAGEYREGDDPDHEKKIWGSTTFGDLEMERGVQPGDRTIFDWREQVRTGNLDEGRKEVAVVLMGEERDGRRRRVGDPEIRWEFEGAWIKEYHPPELDASADGDVATESIVVAFDTMIPDWEPGETELEARIAVESDEPAVGEDVTFDASDSTPAEAIEDYEWTFGDDTAETTDEPEITTTYESPGEYTVGLTVEGEGVSDSTTTTVEVQADESDPESERDLEYYADDDGVVRSEGRTEAFADWREGTIDTDLLLDVINAWYDGEPVT